MSHASASDSLSVDAPLAGQQSLPSCYPTRLSIRPCERKRLACRAVPWSFLGISNSKSRSTKRSKRLHQAEPDFNLRCDTRRLAVFHAGLKAPSLDRCDSFLVQAQT